MTEESAKRSHFADVKEHAIELREFEGPDWDSNREDLELLWNVREVLSRSVGTSELERELSSEPNSESSSQSNELPTKDAELLLVELGTLPIEANLTKQNEEKVENAERPL